MRKAARKAAQTSVRSGPARSKKRDESLYHKGSCKMRLMSDQADEIHDFAPGDFRFERETSTVDGREATYDVMWARWPDGSLACLPVHRLAPTPIRKPSWFWNGNVMEPTLTPSVHHIGHWHGYVTAGRMVSV